MLAGKFRTSSRLVVDSISMRNILSGFGVCLSCSGLLEAILDGRHPSDLTVKTLSRRHLPLDWAEQRTHLGFPPARVACK